MILLILFLLFVACMGPVAPYYQAEEFDYFIMLDDTIIASFRYKADRDFTIEKMNYWKDPEFYIRAERY